jgi:hypothetical protein
MKVRSLFRLVCGAALALVPLFTSIGSAGAQPEQAARASAVKAAYLYKFADFVEWPAGTFQRPDQTLVIGVWDDDEVAADLEQLAGGRAPDVRPVSVRRVHDAASAGAVHVLFMGARRENRLREALDAVPGPVLIVTDQANALRLGSVLNFSAEAGRIRFGASLSSAEARNLKLSARLLAVAQLIEGGRNR